MRGVALVDSISLKCIDSVKINTSLVIVSVRECRIVENWRSACGVEHCVGVGRPLSPYQGAPQ